MSPLQLISLYFFRMFSLSFKKYSLFIWSKNISTENVCKVSFRQLPLTDSDHGSGPCNF